MVMANAMNIPVFNHYNRDMAAVKPGKVDSLFPISHFLNFDAGGWSLFIIHLI